jgi:hypothetical protein
VRKLTSTVLRGGDDGNIIPLTRPWRDGVVEGKVNKLKLIKRMGYGRASFRLLRQRVLQALEEVSQKLADKQREFASLIG